MHNKEQYLDSKNEYTQLGSEDCIQRIMQILPSYSHVLPDLNIDRLYNMSKDKEEFATLFSQLISIEQNKILYYITKNARITKDKAPSVLIKKYYKLWADQSPSKKKTSLLEQILYREVEFSLKFWHHLSLLNEFWKKKATAIKNKNTTEYIHANRQISEILMEIQLEKEYTHEVISFFISLAELAAFRDNDHKEEQMIIRDIKTIYTALLPESIAHTIEDKLDKESVSKEFYSEYFQELRNAASDEDHTRRKAFVQEHKQLLYKISRSTTFQEYCYDEKKLFHEAPHNFICLPPEEQKTNDITMLLIEDGTLANSLFVKYNKRSFLKLDSAIFAVEEMDEMDQKNIRAITPMSLRNNHLYLTQKPILPLQTLCASAGMEDLYDYYETIAYTQMATWIHTYQEKADTIKKQQSRYSKKVADILEKTTFEEKLSKKIAFIESKYCKNIPTLKAKDVLLILQKLDIIIEDADGDHYKAKNGNLGVQKRPFVINEDRNFYGTYIKNLCKQLNIPLVYFVGINEFSSKELNFIKEDIKKRQEQ